MVGRSVVRPMALVAVPVLIVPVLIVPVLVASILLPVAGAQDGGGNDELDTTTTTGFGVPTDDGEGRRIDGDVVVGGDGVDVVEPPRSTGFGLPVPLAVIFLGIGVVALGTIGFFIRRSGDA